MTEPSTSAGARKGRYRQDSQEQTILREGQNVQVQPQASQSNLMGIQQQTSTTTRPAGGFERLIMQDKQQKPHPHAHPQASLSNLPQLGTGLTPDTVRRGRKWFKMALPSYDPATKAIKEDVKDTLLPGSRSFTERETYSSLHGRRTAGSNLDVIIVTEFLIYPKDPTVPFQRGFEDSISRRYNDEVPIEYPRMTRKEEKVYPGITSKWSLFASHWFVMCPTTRERSKVRLVSPRLSTSTNTSSNELTTSHPPPWHQAIHIMWRHLHSNYTVQTDSTCRTSINLIYAEIYTSSQLKQITSAILHFEPVMCVLTNQHHHHHHHHEEPNLWKSPILFPQLRVPKRNYRDNPRLGARDPTPLSRTESLALIASSEPNPKLGLPRYLIDLLNPPSQDNREYRWALQGIAQSGLIRHTQLPACEESEDAIRWAELTVAFIQGALACRIQELERIRPDHEGLRAFMSGVRTRSDGSEWRRGSG
ncbi:hypothetical protein EPUS_09019 [Endocarpon pusillum Z07020]|uniref:Uncharacterized protein n=1 Tax=Endocarpon pusillum (strain Z07020 / HMAS-L-300199) TaxID=1263415 RepID=U1HFR5_ENDPU|nr:uncharacterized protein EPUS_09019 [Endocarpon pusillum Z07020]ERF68965.1 hypothetical protein EPUS_09019 [Endocarpon pusillum Z07020]